MSIARTILSAKTPAQKAHATRKLNKYIRSQADKGLDPKMVAAGIKASLAKVKRPKANKLIVYAGILINLVRDANREELEELRDQLKAFSNAWAVSGEGMDFPCAGSCNLADLDISEQIHEGVEIKLENL